MIPSFIISFREVLEAALVVGIILSYLVKTKQTKHNNVVYYGVISGILASIIGAILFTNIAGGFAGRAEKIFEGITMLVGAFLLTTIILWMIKQKHIAKDIEQRVATEINNTHKFGLFALVFVAVLREGIETVIFLSAASFVSTGKTMAGAFAGIIAATLLGYAIFLGSMKINLSKFFNITSILLILFAAGLVAHGVHELQEAKIISTVKEHVWDINPPVYPDGSYPILHERGYFGDILKSLFGYNGNPSLIEILCYTLYLGLVFVLWKKVEKEKKRDRFESRRA